MTRRRWLIGANVPLLTWLLVAALFALTAPAGETDTWVLTHVALLGAAGSGILVWSEHFTMSLLRLRDLPRAAEVARLVLFNGATIALIVGELKEWPQVMVGAALVVVAVFGWHGAVLYLQLRGSLPARFSVSVRYYIVATALVIAGSLAGAALASGRIADPTDAQWNIAHILVNVEGWLVLTIIGTLVTFWPTMLGTQVSPDSVVVARRALPVLTISVVIAAVGAALGVTALLVVGQVGYLGAVVWSFVPFARQFVTRKRVSFAAASVLASQLWLIVWAVSVIVRAFICVTFVDLEESLIKSVIVVAAGVAAQILIGSLGFLLPMALANGPARVRANTARLGVLTWPRVAALNLGVALVWTGNALDNSVVTRVGLALFALGVLTFAVLAASVLVGRGISKNVES